MSRTDDESTSEERLSKGIPLKESKETPPEEVDFIMSVGLTSEEAAAALIKHGKNELPEKITPKVSDVLLSGMQGKDISGVE